MRADRARSQKHAWAGAFLVAACLSGCGATYPGWPSEDDWGLIGAGAGGRSSLPWPPVPLAGLGGAAGAAGSTGTAGVAGGSTVPSPGTGGASPGWSPGEAGWGGTMYPDRDFDGVDASADCDDLDPSIYPGALDSCCDGIDHDCDGRDGPQGARCPCRWEVDADGDGWLPGLGPASDCDDTDPTVHPMHPEICNDGVDNDCNGIVDYADAACPLDQDGDGYPADSDCDDLNPIVHPDHPELCGDGLDNDCDGLVDPYPLCTTASVDWDGDGFPFELDCNDGNAWIYPGSPWELCCDLLDSNCDGLDEPVGASCECNANDADGDGYGVGNTQPGLADCNDQDPLINPGALEICDDGRDNDCDSLIDADDPFCQPTP